MSSNLSIALLIGASVGSAVAGINKVGASLKVLRDKTISTNDKILHFGKTSVLSFSALTAGVGATIGTLNRLAEPAIEFESAMADVKKVVDFDSPEQFKKMEKDILNLTRQIPMAGEEIAAIVATGGQAGLARESLLGYAEAAAKMGVAFDMAAGDAGTAMATMANVLVKPIHEMSVLGDAINHLSDNANSKAADIVNVITRAGSDTRLLGLTENQTAAFASTFLAMGKAPELAAQGIRGITAAFQKLKAGDKAKELQQIGYTTKSFAEAMNKDAQGAILDFIERIRELPENQQYAFAANIFGSQYADEIMLLMQNTEEYRRQLELLQEVDESGRFKYIGSMQREFENRSNTTANNLQLMRNSLAEIGITIGNALLPPLNSLINKVKPVVYRFAEFLQQHPALLEGLVMIGTVLISAAGSMLLLSGVGSGLITIFLSLGKVFGVATVISGGLVKGLFSIGKGGLKITRLFSSGLFKAIVITAKGFISINQLGFKLAGVLAGSLYKGLMLAGRGILFVSRAIGLNPIGLAVMAIAGAAYLIYKYWEPIKGFFSRLWGKVKDFFNSGIGNISKTILDWSPIGLFYKAFASVLSWFGVDLPKSFSEFGGKLMSKFTDGFMAVFNTVKNSISGTVDWIKDKLGFATSAEVSIANTKATLSTATSIANQVPQFYTGGFTGVGGKYEPAGIVHKEEFVFDQEATKRIGVSNLTRIANGEETPITPARPSLREAFAQRQQAQQTVNGTGQVVVHFNPTINVNGNDKDGILNEVKQGLNMSLTEFERMLNRVLDQRQRRAYT